MHEKREGPVSGRAPCQVTALWLPSLDIALLTTSRNMGKGSMESGAGELEVKICRFVARPLAPSVSTCDPLQIS